MTFPGHDIFLAGSMLKDQKFSRLHFVAKLCGEPINTHLQKGSLMNIFSQARFAFLPLAMSAALGVPAMAEIIYVDGDDVMIGVNNGAFFTGTDTTVPSSFRTPELIKNQGNETKTSVATPLSTIAYILQGGTPYFQFIFEQQETANNDGNPNRERVIFTDLSIFVGPDTDFANAVLVWELTPADDVYVNDQNRLGGPFPATNKPLGEGGDATLNIPFALFPDGTTSDHFLYLRVSQTDSDNGGEEWVTHGSGLTLPQATLIPEPSTWLLTMTGLACLVDGRLQPRAHTPPPAESKAPRALALKSRRKLLNEDGEQETESDSRFFEPATE